MPEDLGLVRAHLVQWAADTHVMHSPAANDAQMTQALDDAPRPLDSQALIDHLTLGGLSVQIGAVLGGEPLPLREQVGWEQIGRQDMPAEAEMRWWHFFGLLSFDRLVLERDAAVREWVDRNDAPSERRMRALAEVCAALRGGEQADDEEWNG